MWLFQLIVDTLLYFTYGRNEGRIESIVTEPEQNASFPNARVSNKQQLEQQVVTFLGHFEFIIQAAVSRLISFIKFLKKSN